MTGLGPQASVTLADKASNILSDVRPEVILSEYFVCFCHTSTVDEGQRVVLVNEQCA